EPEHWLPGQHEFRHQPFCWARPRGYPVDVSPHADHGLGTTAYPPPLSIPATAPLASVASVPERIDLRPRPTISSLGSGTMAPSPPSMMPRLPKFANPQSA